MEQITKKIDDLVNSIKESELYLEYIDLKKIVDDKYSLDIQKLKSLNDKFLEIKKYGKYHPDFESTSKEVNDLLTKLNNYEEVKKFYQKEEELNHLLEEIEKKIKSSSVLFELNLDKLF